MSQNLQNAIVESSHQLYSSLPAHGKPLIRSNGVPEWTILSTFSLVVPQPQIGPQTRVIPISLGTGVKCLPYSKLSEYGDTLHDSHAEIIARRGFLRWLLWQAHLQAQVTRGERVEEELFVEIREEEGDRGRLRLKDGVQMWLYISVLPCGDASTYYTSIHQPAEEASQWTVTDGDRSRPSNMGVIRGRNGYTAISTLRTKPGRPDSIPSISMSCSDKIASWSVLGIQGGLLANLFQPIYLDGIIVGGLERPANRIEKSPNAWEDQIKQELKRSLWGRLESINALSTLPYTLQRPSIYLTSIPFEHSKMTMIHKQQNDSSDLGPSPSPLSLSHLPFLPSTHPKKGTKPEIIAEGGILGFPWKKGVLIKEKGRSRICKLSLLIECEKLLLNEKAKTLGITNDGTYYKYKHLTVFGREYQHNKMILRGIPGHRQSVRGLENFEAISSTGVPGSPKIKEEPPFRGWLVSGKQFESFTSSGQIHR
ncbi:hypothetical protein I204_01607 [Kwoniella mangroviensis CBS 8886]|nr:hypothetical protein I204_01607 [Kwoniella mangroviensis CBS 8886]